LTPYDTERLAQEAQSALNNEALQRALGELTEEQVAIFKGRGPVEEMEMARSMVHALEMITGRLQSFVDDATMLAHRLNRSGPK
jgi:hypothetical protein